MCFILLVQVAAQSQSEASTASGTARHLGFGADGAAMEPGLETHDLTPSGQPPLPMNMGTATSYQTVQHARRTTTLIPSDPRIDGARAGTSTGYPSGYANGDQTAEPTTHASPPTADSNFSAEWFNQASAGHTLIKLSNPENEHAFTDDDVRTSLEAALVQLGIENSPKTIINSLGQYGPYQTSLLDAHATELAEAGDIDIFSITGDQENAFNVILLNKDGSNKQRAEESARKHAEHETRVANNRTKAANRKLCELRLFMDGPPQLTAFATHDRDKYFDKAVSNLKIILSRSSLYPPPDRVSYTKCKTESLSESNSIVIFVTLPCQVNDWIHKVPWYKIRYVHMGNLIPPPKARMPKPLRETLRIKPCCLARKCTLRTAAGSDARCDAYGNAMRASGLITPRFGSVTHEAETQERKRAREERAGTQKVKQLRALEERRDRVCPNFLLGKCHRKCTRAHPAEHGQQIMCYSRTAEGIAEGFTCPHGDDCLFKLIPDPNEPPPSSTNG